MNLCCGGVPVQDTVAEMAKDITRRKGSGSAQELYDFIKKVGRACPWLLIPVADVGRGVCCGSQPYRETVSSVGAELHISGAAHQVRSCLLLRPKRCKPSTTNSLFDKGYLK